MSGKTKKKPVIFLDVDGVLNRCALSSQGLEPDKVMLLERIVVITGAEVVISSTWRTKPHLLKRLTAVLTRAGIKIAGRTPDLTVQCPESGIYRSVERGHEIQKWLEGNPEVTDFVILDDDPAMLHLMVHLVQTDSSTGLTEPLTRRAIGMLQTGLRPTLALQAAGAAKVPILRPSNDFDL